MAVLLLTSSYEALRVIPITRAFTLVFDGKAEVVEESDEVWRSARAAYPVPKVVRLLKSVRIPYRARIPLNRRAVLARDHERCAYQGQPRKRTDPQCTGRASTIDHVMPRAKLGNRAHRWENVVASCPACNHFKGERTLDELGWKLTFEPYAPTGVRWVVLGIALDPAWEPYLAVA